MYRPAAGHLGPLSIIALCVCPPPHPPKNIQILKLKTVEQKKSLILSPFEKTLDTTL